MRCSTRAFSDAFGSPSPAMSTFGAVGGKGESTTAYEPASCGVVRPQSEEKSVIPLGPGGLLKYVTARRGPVPRQVPRNAILRTSSVPSSIDPGARARAVRLRHEHAVADHDPARPAVRDREVVAVHAHRGRRRREPPLHRRDRLAREHRLVREHRPQPVEPGRPRPADDMDRDRPVRRELHRALVRHVREELLGAAAACAGSAAARAATPRGRARRRSHGPTEASATRRPDLQVLQDSNSDGRVS